jgi:hypothetical protein
MAPRRGKRKGNDTEVTRAMNALGLGADVDTGTDEGPRSQPRATWPKIVADREDRESMGITQADYGHKWRSAYRQLLGDTPKCGPDDRDTARQFLARIEQALDTYIQDEGGTFSDYSDHWSERVSPWTDAERRRLTRMRATWKARAEGRDIRFVHYGNRPGRTPGYAPSDARSATLRIVDTITRSARAHLHGQSIYYSD